LLSFFLDCAVILYKRLWLCKPCSHRHILR